MNEQREALAQCLAQIQTSETLNRDAAAQIETLANASAEHARVQQLVENRRRLDTLRAGLEKGREQQQRLAGKQAAAETALSQASENTRTLAAAWTSAQAAVLASQLQPGSPCAVCGSTEHPQPAHQGGAVPDGSALEEASAREESARNTRDTLRGELEHTARHAGRTAGR